MSTLKRDTTNECEKQKQKQKRFDESAFFLQTKLPRGVILVVGLGRAGDFLSRGRLPYTMPPPSPRRAPPEPTKVYLGRSPSRAKKKFLPIAFPTN